MEVAVDEVLKTGKIAEACVCYTGDILDEKRDKYTLDYYIKTAKEIENMGAHILGIKDMAGLLKTVCRGKTHQGAEKCKFPSRYIFILMIQAVTVSPPYCLRRRMGVDIVDTSFNNMSGVTSQPALNSIVAALEYTERDTGLNRDSIQEISDYWSDIRPIYYQFESGLKSGTAEVYKYEIPGGQYSNLKSQVDSFGLGHKFKEVQEMYMTVNLMVGDIVKVTPSSKMVGDLAIFMVKNDLTPDNIVVKGRDMAFPDSVVSFYEGMMGQPCWVDSQARYRSIVLKGKTPITCRPGELLPPVDFEKLRNELGQKTKIPQTMRDVLSYALYPKVYEEYLSFIKKYGDLSRMDSPLFFDGLVQGIPFDVELDEGKVFIIELMQIDKIDSDGYRRVVFEVNGNRREMTILDTTYRSEKTVAATQLADPANPKEIGAGIPGSVSKILVKTGDAVKEGQSLLIIEAMKMETNITAPASGVIVVIAVKEGQKVKTGELLIKIE